MAIHVGCGSWADAEYTGILYSKGLPAKDRLKAYATHFDQVEVNASYYSTPRRETVAAWDEQTPPGFIFHLRLHRVFSQSPTGAMKGDLLPRMLGAVEPLVAAG